MDDYSDINVCCVEKFSEFKWNHQTQMNLILIFFLNEWTFRTGFPKIYLNYFQIMRQHPAFT
jgi:hypothetical protein